MVKFDEFDDELDEEEEDFNDDEVITYACEDCDYRWEISNEDGYEDIEFLICPMCGSAHITEF